MKKQPLRFTLYAIIIYLTGCVHIQSCCCRYPTIRGKWRHISAVLLIISWDKRHSDQFPNRHYAQTFAANLNVGEPRTVRMIYFTPNNWQYRASIAQQLKDTIRTVQTFYAEQMQAHGYGEVTFRFETDPQGEPMVHHVVGEHPDLYYFDNIGPMFDEIERKFDLSVNIYLIFIDSGPSGIGSGGFGARQGKEGGFAFLPPFNISWGLAAHELGHAFGLPHDFRDGSFIMSYGPGWSRLSACAAEFLSVHPYFNFDIPIEEGELPIVELISPRTYPAGTQSVPVRLKVSDSNGLHQVRLHDSDGLIACHGLKGEKDAVVTFDYDGTFSTGGSLTSVVAHSLYVEAVDTEGNVGRWASFVLTERSPYHITTIKGHTDAVNFVTFPRDGETLASGSWEVKLWDVATQQNIATLPVWSNAVAFSTDGKKIAFGLGDRVNLWDVTTQQNIGTFEGHTNQVSSVALSRSMATVLASGLMMA